VPLWFDWGRRYRGVVALRGSAWTSRRDCETRECGTLWFAVLTIRTNKWQSRGVWGPSDVASSVVARRRRRRRRFRSSCRRPGFWGFRPHTYLRIDRPEGVVPLWFDWGWFRRAVVASSSSWGVVVTALMSTRRRALLLNVGVDAPVGKAVGGAVGPPIRRRGGREPWWRTSAVVVVDWTRSLGSGRVGGPHEGLRSTNRGAVPSVRAVALRGAVHRVLRWSQCPASFCCTTLPSHLSCGACVLHGLAALPPGSGGTLRYRGGTSRGLVGASTHLGGFLRTM